MTTQGLTFGNKEDMKKVPAYPCGLMAKSFFNDSFVLKDPLGKVVPINESGIAWDTDKSTKFKPQISNPEKSWLDVTDEHFIVWARNSGLENFRKLWGRIDEPLPAGKKL